MEYHRGEAMGTVARYLVLTAALSLATGCAQTVPLTPTSLEAAGLPGKWTGSWRSAATSGKFVIEIVPGADDRLTATAVWHGLPLARRVFAGTLTEGRLILGDPETEGLALTAQRRGVGGLAPSKALGKRPDLVGPFTMLLGGRPFAGTVEVSRED
jgi:hypothetical protein